MRIVLQHHIDPSWIGDLKPHWGQWFNNYSPEKRERIFEFEKHIQRKKWEELLASRKGLIEKPVEYWGYGWFG